MSKLEEKRFSFKELSSHIDNGLYNSNMQNLVQAVKNVENELREIAKRQKFLEDLKKEITTYAEGGEDAVLNTTKVNELFHKYSNTKFKNDRW